MTKKQKAGRKATHDLWHQLCSRQAAAVRLTRSASQLLRLPAGRKVIADLGGRKYSAEADRLATRSVIAEAHAIIKDRQDRQGNRQIVAEALSPAVTPAARLAERLREERAEKRRQKEEEVELHVERLVLRNYRKASGSWAGGDNDVSVGFNVTPDVQSKIYRQWSSNKKWSGNSVAHRVNVPPTWLQRVAYRKLACLDGLVTLDAKVDSRHEDCVVYAATWIRQGKGLALRTESGWVATDGKSHHYHSTSSAKAAATGVRRKLADAEKSPEEIAAIEDQRERARAERRRIRAEKRARSIAKLTERIRRYDMGSVGHVVVSLKDSYRAGNCKPGTLDFRDKLFSDERDSASITEIVAAARSRGISEDDITTSETGRLFIGACLQAIRKTKQ